MTAGCSLTLIRAFRHWIFFWSHVRRQSWIIRYINIVIFVFLAGNVLDFNTTALR